MFTKSLSRIALVSGLILSAGTIVPRVALADDSGVGKEVTGHITPVQTLTFTVASPAPEILVQAGEQTLVFGTLDTTTNVMWEVNAISANNSFLKHTDDTTTIAYTFHIVDGEAAQALSTTSKKVYDGGTTFAGVTAKNIELIIPANGANGKKSGNYKDTITLTIIPKQ